MVFFLVCIILFLNNFSKLKLIGALTSKPFAFKVWSWELNTSYIVDLTGCFNDKLKVDSKGLEIVRVLPWLNNNLEEQWISDKVRFTYDGFSLNWISKFFLKKKNLLYPLIFMLMQLLDPIFSKYFEKFNKIFVFHKYSLFKNKKENIYSLFFSFFQVNFVFQNLLENYNFLKTKILLNFFNWSQKNLIKFLSRKKSTLLLVILNNYFFKRKFKFKYKNFLFKKLNKLDYLSINNLNSVIISYTSTFCYGKKINLMLEPNFNLLLIGVLKHFNFQFLKKNNKKFIANKFFFFTENFNFQFLKNKFSKIIKLMDLKKFNTIILYNINVRVVQPSLHLFLKKLVKNSDLLVILIAAYENLLFKHINLGNKIRTLVKIINGQHWVTNFIAKKPKIGFFFNYENNNFINFSNFQWKIEILNEFTFNFNIKYKFYFLAKFYFFPFFSYNIVNNFNSLDYLLNKKKKTNLFLFNKINKNSSNIYIYNTTFNHNLNIFLCKDLYNIKKNLFILLESNLNDYNTKKWDFIFPTTIITENFFLIKNFFLKANKSLFLKFGPWFGWSFFNFLIYFFNLSIYPFFFLKKNYIFQNIIFYFLNFWLEGSILFKKLILEKSIKFNFKSNINIILTNLILNNDKKKNYLNNNSKNVWYTELSFIKSSKYWNLGYNLLKKEKTSF